MDWIQSISTLHRPDFPLAMGDKATVANTIKRLKKKIHKIILILLICRGHFPLDTSKIKYKHKWCNYHLLNIVTPLRRIKFRGD